MIATVVYFKNRQGNTQNVVIDTGTNRRGNLKFSHCMISEVVNVRAVRVDSCDNCIFPWSKRIAI